MSEKKFVKPSEISNALRCIVCQLVYQKPMRLYCSHTFCLSCIMSICKAKSNCPVCRTPIDTDNIGFDLIAKRIIDQMQVYCTSPQCNWKGQNAMLQLHIQYECQLQHIAEKSSKQKTNKPQLINIDNLKSQQVQQKINQNLIKGSLQVRVRQRGQQQSLIDQSQSNQNSRAMPIAQTDTFDFLESIFD